MSAHAVLSVRDLAVDYFTDQGRVRAVDGISFDVAPGEIFGLAGESGSGKSTAAKAILRILEAPAVITGGNVLCQGRDVLEMDERELQRMRWRRAALVFQSAMNVLNPVMTVGEQLCDVLIAHRPIGQPLASERAAELLQLVGIDARHLRSYPHQLSGGMRQRVVIAMALALDPPLLIMDEPTTALDVVVQREILGQLAELQARRQFSILFITHDVSLMIEFSSRIGVMYAGRLVEVAPAGTIATSPQHPYTRGLLRSFPSLRGPRRNLTGIAGTPPDMRRPPSGCPFHPRCPDALGLCRSEVPELRALRRSHIAACHVLQ